MAAIDSTCPQRKRVRDRLGRGGAAATPSVCKYWLLGACYRSTCNFLHIQTQREKHSLESDTKNNKAKVCRFWVSGNCGYGESCKFLHSWFQSNDGKFSPLARLEGHKKAVTGIEIPAGSDKLYSSSRDGTIRVWDCNTGKCTDVINTRAEIGAFTLEGSWVFIGFPNLVKAWPIGAENFGSGEVRIPASVGQVNAIVTSDDMLFAGTEIGAILAWRFHSAIDETLNFEPVKCLVGHTRGVSCLSVGKGRLYSSSMDGTICEWDIEKLQCIHTLKEHNHAVMSLLCYDQYLLSCSLDGTVHVWAATKEGSLEVIYSHKEEVGILALFGMMDSEDKPVLFFSCDDNSVRLYELPSFSFKGKIFAKKEVQTIQQGPNGLFFTGDATGVVSVWKWLAQA